MTSAGMSSRDFAIFTMLTTAHYFNHCPRRMNSGVCGAGSVLIFELLSDELPLAKARGTLFWQALLHSGRSGVPTRMHAEKFGLQA